MKVYQVHNGLSRSIKEFEIMVQVAVQRLAFSRSPAEESLIERDDLVVASNYQNRPGRAVGLERAVRRQHRQHT